MEKLILAHVHVIYHDLLTHVCFLCPFRIIISGYLRDTHLRQYSESSILLGHIAPVHRSTSMGFYFSGSCLLVACLLACPLRWLSKREFSPAEARDSIASMPLDVNSPGAYDYGGMTHAVDGEWLAVAEQPQGLTNFGACFSDAVQGVLDQPDYHMAEQQLLQTQQQQQSTPPIDRLVVPPVVPNPSLPAAAGSTVPALSGPPCTLSTINETSTANATDILLSNTAPATPTTALAHSPVLEDVTSLTAAVIGVGPGLVVPSSAVTVPMISPGTSTPVEVR